MNIVMVDKPVAFARAWRIQFRASASENDVGSLVQDAPRPLDVASEEIDVLEELTADHPNKESAEFVLIWLPPGATEVEQRAESWVRAQAPLIRSSISTIRVVWSNNRALFYCSRGQFEAGYDAVVRFTAIAREADALEREMASTWQIINVHVPFAHTARARSKLKEINKATEKVIETRMALLRAQTSLEQLDGKLDSTSKRLCAELIRAANLHDRLEMLEGPIQFANDHYEIVNSRLIETKNANRGIWLEVLIALLIAINTGAILVDEKLRTAVVDKIRGVPDILVAAHSDKKMASGAEADAEPTAERGGAAREGKAVAVARETASGAVDVGASTGAGNEAASNRRITPESPADPASATKSADKGASESPKTPTEKLDANTANRTTAIGDGKTEIAAASAAIPVTGALDAGACQTALSSMAIGEKIPFRGGTSSMQRAFADTLRRSADILKRCRNVEIEVRGYADSSGDVAAYQKLARRRAQAVVSYLVREGVKTNLLTGVGYGASTNDTADQRAENRVIEFVVVNQRDGRERHD
jgi:outer membrane protein OmpA-like peptidoglycan-associated protein